MSDTPKLWTVFHPDGDELGLTSREFGTEREAIAKCEEWNKTYPGHVVISPVLPAATGGEVQDE